ncbi:hypothetical protein NPM07_18700 [Bacillus cereus]|nr:hypothetical protein [Bacillus cereus]
MLRDWGLFLGFRGEGRRSRATEHRAAELRGIELEANEAGVHAVR